MSRQRFIAKGKNEDMAAVGRGLRKFIPLIPSNGMGIITVPIIRNLKLSPLEKHLVDSGFGALTKGDRRMQLPNGTRLHLAPCSVNVLREADVILAIWATDYDLPQLEEVRRWQSMVVVGHSPEDWRIWEATHKPLVLD